MEWNIKDERNKFFTTKEKQNQMLNILNARFGSPMRFPSRDDQ